MYHLPVKVPIFGFLMTFQLGAAYSIRNCLSSELQIGIYMNLIGAECAKLFKNENWSAGTCCIRGENSE